MRMILLPSGVLTRHQTPSWQWYYPYHFAPFAADFTDVEQMDIKFNLGQPFKPFEQLMSVFPAARSVPHAALHTFLLIFSQPKAHTRSVP